MIQLGSTPRHPVPHQHHPSRPPTSPCPQTKAAHAALIRLSFANKYNSSSRSTPNKLSPRKNATTRAIKKSPRHHHFPPFPLLPHKKRRNLQGDSAHYQIAGDIINEIYYSLAASASGAAAGCASAFLPPRLRRVRVLASGAAPAL